MRRIGTGWLVAAALLLGAPPLRAGTTPEVVTIGVRQDARPFAWQADDNPGTYRGYLVDICTDAATRAGFRFRLVPVDATARERILERATSRSRRTAARSRSTCSATRRRSRSPGSSASPATRRPSTRSSPRSSS